MLKSRICSKISIERWISKRELIVHVEINNMLIDYGIKSLIRLQTIRFVNFDDGLESSRENSTTDVCAQRVAMRWPTIDTPPEHSWILQLFSGTTRN
jgi:hypothetical protein